MSLKFSMATVKTVLIIVLSVGIVGLGAYEVATNPSILQFPKGKPTSILPALSPARDLRGTWISSLSGKGFQLQGQFTTYGSTSTVYEDGDIELIIDDVADNLAYGTIRYYNVCAWGFSIVPKLGKITIPKKCVSEAGSSGIQIGVSSSALDFGTINNNGVVASMSGSYTTDIMNGNMSAVVMPYGEVKGVYQLNRKR